MDDDVAALRAFSRFYTRRIGALHEGLLGSNLSLAEGRVVWELAQTDTTTAAALRATLGLDAGYLSRIVTRLEDAGVIRRTGSVADGRQRDLSLTPAGVAAFRTIDARSRAEIGAMLAPLAPTERMRLVAALATVRDALGDAPPAAPTLRRGHRPGDMGWVVHRHGALYGDEYGFDMSFEALVADIAAAFIRDYDPSAEGCWFAERDGAILGAVTLVRQSAEVAKLRMLYVEPAARGLGLGRALVAACIAFARAAGYARISLWTNDILRAARHIYATMGFVLVATEPPALAFGQMMASETWELDLSR